MNAAIIEDRGFNISSVLKNVREMFLDKGPNTLNGWWNFIKKKEDGIPEVTTIHTRWANDGEKIAQFCTVRERAREERPDAIIFVTEMWVAVLPADTKYRGPPSKHPDRLDGVSVYVETEGHLDMYTMTWGRDGVLSEWRSYEDASSLGGNIGKGFWPRPPQKIFDEIEPASHFFKAYRNHMLMLLRKENKRADAVLIGGPTAPPEVQMVIAMIISKVGKSDWMRWVEAAIAWINEELDKGMS